MDGAKEAIIWACVGRIRAEPDHEELETILAMFAMIGLGVETVEQLLSWEMNVLEKSPLCRQILEEGIQQGMERGLERGLEQGLEESVMRILDRRLGPVPLDLPDRLAELPPAELKLMLDEALSAADYLKFLEQLTRLEQR
jgi:predicted transposase YdaD